MPPFHSLNPLYRSIPLDIPTFLYYQFATFTFSCPSALKSFSSSSLPRENVRKVRIDYGGIADHGPDWVFLVLGAFEKLDEVVFVVEEGCKCCGVGSERLGHWWKCVQDAFREGTGGKNGQKEGGVNLKLEIKKEDRCVAVKDV